VQAQPPEDTFPLGDVSSLLPNIASLRDPLFWMTFSSGRGPCHGGGSFSTHFLLLLFLFLSTKK
jgi:hypothetical protein